MKAKCCLYHKIFFSPFWLNMSIPIMFHSFSWHPHYRIILWYVTTFIQIDIYCILIGTFLSGFLYMIFLIQMIKYNWVSPCLPLTYWFWFWLGAWMVGCSLVADSRLNFWVILNFPFLYFLSKYHQEALANETLDSYGIITSYIHTNIISILY